MIRIVPMDRITPGDAVFFTCVKCKNAIKFNYGGSLTAPCPSCGRVYTWADHVMIT